MHPLIPMAVAAGVLLLAVSGCGQPRLEQDTVKTAPGDLAISCIGHGTLMFQWDRKVIHVDPYGKLADYAALPKADVILITHHHSDHLDLEAIGKIRTPETAIVLTESCAPRLAGCTVMKNGDQTTIMGIKIRAVPAYNQVHKRENGEPFHPKGQGNGYVLSFADKQVYVAGDTEDIPEMANLKDIDVAFLPMNLPYTMTPAMAAAAARSFKPRMLYPYHTGETDVAELVRLLRDCPEIEVRVRPMK